MSLSKLTVETTAYMLEVRKFSVVQMC